MVHWSFKIVNASEIISQYVLTRPIYKKYSKKKKKGKKCIFNHFNNSIIVYLKKNIAVFHAITENLHNRLILKKNCFLIINYLGK